MSETSGYLEVERISETKYQLYCTSCHQPTDIVSSDEITGLLRGGYNCLCMDCDSLQADEISPVLWFPVQPFILWLGSEVRVIDWPSITKEQQDRLEFLRAELRTVLDEKNGERNG